MRAPWSAHTQSLRVSASARDVGVSKRVRTSEQSGAQEELKLAEQLDGTCSSASLQLCRSWHGPSTCLLLDGKLADQRRAHGATRATRSNTGVAQARSDQQRIRAIALSLADSARARDSIATATRSVTSTRASSSCSRAQWALSSEVSAALCSLNIEKGALPCAAMPLLPGINSSCSRALGVVALLAR